MNGENETGVSTFFLQHQIDTGNIILQEKVNISDDMNAEELHDTLMNLGAKLVVETVHQIMDDQITETPQKDFPETELKAAPKIFKDDCLIDWTAPIDKIHNHIRGLSPYPAAWCKLKDKKLKVFKGQKIAEKHNLPIGKVLTDRKTYFKIAVADGYYQIDELQMEGKKRLKTEDFLRGFQNKEADFKFILG
jgi:methionyl-tRNA formyltransferase